VPDVTTLNYCGRLFSQVLGTQSRLGDYNGRIRQAEAFGDLGLKVALENQIADETRHKEELERIIAGWDER
jgi:bacterioferritin